MRIERTYDVELIKRIVTHPRIYPHVTDDASPPPELYTPLDPSLVYWLTPIEGDEVLGAFMLHQHNYVTYEVHTAVLPTCWGQKSVEAGRLLIDWVFTNTSCKKLITHVPENNRLALRLALNTGFALEGVNRKSILKGGCLLDQHLLGIEKRSKQCQ